MNDIIKRRFSSVYRFHVFDIDVEFIEGISGHHVECYEVRAIVKRYQQHNHDLTNPFPSHYHCEVKFSFGLHLAFLINLLLTFLFIPTRCSSLFVMMVFLMILLIQIL